MLIKKALCMRYIINLWFTLIVKKILKNSHTMRYVHTWNTIILWACVHMLASSTEQRDYQNSFFLVCPAHYVPPPAFPLFFASLPAAKIPQQHRRCPTSAKTCEQAALLKTFWQNGAPSFKNTGESSTLKHANISNHPHLYTNFTTFSILARYQPGQWSRSCGMVSLRSSQWEYNYQMAWLWFTCLVLMTKPLLLTKDNGWKSRTIWATIPLWAARALGSSFDQKLEGGGASGKSWGSKVDF